MFAFVKNHGQKLALLLLASRLFTTAVLASPLEFDIETPTDFVARARAGGYVGSKCQVDTDCYSGSCATGDDGVTRTCQRQLPGGPCFENGNCNTRQCDLSKGVCKASAINGLCTDYYDCSGWENGKVTCQDKKCKIKDNNTCSQNVQCASGLCSNQVCRQRAQVPNSACFVDAECLSGSCAAVKVSQCTKPDGSFTYCPGTTEKHCTRYPLGHKCANNGECNEGFCRNSKCVASANGDTCTEQYQCTGPSVCGSDGKCYTPAAASLFPTDVCDVGFQCLSGRCLIDQQQKDNYYVNTVILKDQYPARCDYFANGQSGCRSFRDCSIGLCESGTCKLGKDGDRCQVNYNCQGLCSSGENGGVCFTPASPGSQGRGDPCKTNDQCLSGSCKFNYDSVTRPNIDGDFLIGVSDTSCEGSTIGGSCIDDGDCSEGSCSSNGKCALLPLGAACREGYQCDTNTCIYADPYGSEGACSLAEYYTQCSRNDQCYSGECVRLHCPNTKDDACVYYGCKGVTLGGSCRSINDCYSVGLTCTDGQCVAREGY